MSYGDARDFGNKPQDRQIRPRTQWPTANVEDLVMVEDVPVDGEFVPLYIGQARDEFSNLKLVAEKEVEGTGAIQWIRRIWATTARTGQEAYNLSIKYVNESGTHPVFIREYIILESSYAALTIGSALGALTGLTIAAGGSNYTLNTYNLAFSGGGGSGAAGKIQLRDGVIVGVLLTNGGMGYTSAPTVTITGGDGSGGSITASIQSQIAYLTAQEAVPAEGEMGNLFFKVTRVWTTLPGPVIASTKLDFDGAVLTQSKQLKLLSTITSGETLTGSAPSQTWTKTTKEPISSIHGYEVVESRAVLGTEVTTSFYDSLTQTIVTETKQLVAYNTAAPTITNYLTDYRDVPQNSALVNMRIIRTYPSSITSKTIVEYRKERFTYYALLTSIATGSIARLDGGKEFYVNPVIEAERVRTVPAKVTTTFVTQIATGLPTPLVISPQRLTRRGPLFSLSTGAVLTDGDTLTATTGSGDPVYGSGVVDTFNFSASSPTKSAWVSARAAGSYFVYDFEVKKIAESLYTVSKFELPYL